MTPSGWTTFRVSLVAGVLVLFAPLSARAQASVLGKGWLLDSAGSLTSAPAEAIAGNRSIKGSSSGPDDGMAKPFLNTDPTFIRFTPFEKYTITFSYRVVAALSGDFAFGFFSSTAERAGHFLPTAVIAGIPGASGTATLTTTLESYTDVRAGFTVNGVGTILIDDLRITNGAGQVLVSENAEGPTIVPGLLGFQLTDAMTLVPEGGGYVRSLAAADLEGDGYPETILTLSDPSTLHTTSLRPIVVSGKGAMELTTEAVFPSGAPTTKPSPLTLFTDINNDGLPDLLFAEAQFDGPYTGPRTGPGLGVALNLGGGRFRNLQPLIPSDQQTNRSYALVAGDILGDGRVNILLGDTDDGSNTALLRWNGTGFDQQKNWIAPSLWKAPANLVRHDWLMLADLDRDGRQDLLVGGSPAPCTPNLQILFGAPGGFASTGLVQLPNGLFGQGPCATTSPIAHNAGAGPIVIADFNNDGMPDIFAHEEEVLTYQPGVITDTNEPDYAQIRATGGLVFANTGIQVLLNQGSRTFVDVTSSSSVQNLGHRTYSSPIAVDLNHDGFVDVLGSYTTKLYAGVPPRWGATLFLNDGTGAFQVVDGAQVLAAITTTPSNGQQWNLGAFVPTVVTPERTEGIFVESVGGCSVGFCAAVRLNLYKVVANKAIGTGPNFADSATLGVPGFNEFYYLRHHPDAAAAVQRGEYPSGLAHFLAVGAVLGYAPHAPRAAIDPTVSVAPAVLRFGATNSGTALVAQTASQTLRISQTGSGTVTWTASSNQPWLTVSPASGTGPAELRAAVIFHGALPLSGQSAGSITVTFSGARISSTTVTVTLTTLREGSASGPFGVFDTPAGDNTVLSGSIAVTGWALDDIGINRVEIWRDLQPGETTPPFASTPSDPRNGKVFIANGTFIDGARPDVEALYSTTPLANRAGWGYLLLTWGLWSQGNGTYKLYAYAFDQEGNVATIGGKTIVVSNATATRPFGSIDTPAIGGDPGTSPNFGWGLTPKVNGVATCRIPVNGVQVSIDSGPLQPVIYGDVRGDIAGAFSGFSNSAAAGGHFVFDWSTLANGTHTIGWLITDDCNRADGVGSRFFNVTAGTNLMAAPEFRLKAGKPGSLVQHESDAPITVAKGYGELPLVVDPGLGGSRTIEVHQGERIEVRLPRGFDTVYQLGPGGQTRALPAGATWDAASGTFYWQPAPGFFGRYRIVFSNGSQRVSVRVVVVP
jgi:hypothetical protein